VVIGSRAGTCLSLVLVYFYVWLGFGVAPLFPLARVVCELRTGPVKSVLSVSGLHSLQKHTRSHSVSTSFAAGGPGGWVSTCSRDLPSLCI
jgi:hypothetical protein